MADNNCISIKKKTVIDVTDPEYFCSKSWTLSFNVNTNSWISFHTYIPNWYIGENNFYYSGLNTGCDLEALAIEQVPYTTSTTTSLCIGCRQPEPTTTTTTTVLYCDIEGEVIELTCTIEGTAIDTTPTTTTTSSSTTSTTTTLCPNCNTYLLINETSITQTFTITSCYTGESFLTFIPGAASINVCSCTEPDVPPIVSSELVFSGGCAACFCYTITNNTGKIADYTYINCSGETISNLLAPDESSYACAQQGSVNSFFPLTIEGGINYCSEDMNCDPVKLCMPIYIDDATETGFTKFYKYDLSTNTSTLLSVPHPLFGQSDVAISFNKMWTVLGGISGGNTSFHEWDITINPWSATFNRDILFPAGFVPCNGLTALSNTKLVTINEIANPCMVVEIDVSGSSAVMTNKFSIPVDEYVSGDMIVTTTGKFLVTTENKNTGDVSLYQYDYATGAFEVQVITTGTINQPYGLFESGGNIYIGEGGGKIFEILPHYPYTLTVVGTTPVPISGMAQLPSCMSTHLEPTCCCYTLATKGTSIAAWTGCDGVEYTQSFTKQITVCAKQGYVTVDGVYSLDYIKPGGCGCTTSLDCGKGGGGIEIIPK